MEPTTTFPDALRKARKEAGWSQSRLAEEAGFDHSYVSRLESGARVPTQRAVRKLAAAMGHKSGSDASQELMNAANYIEGGSAIVSNRSSVSSLHFLLENKNIPEWVRNWTNDAIHGLILLLREYAHEGATNDTETRTVRTDQPGTTVRLDEEGLEYLRRIQGDHIPSVRAVGRDDDLSRSHEGWTSKR